MKTITLGDRGASVLEIRSLLQSLQLLPSGEAAIPLSDPQAYVYDTDCVLAVRQFQQERGLIADGNVDADTYHELVGAGLRLGDRPLSLQQRMLHGDDVRQLQQQLAELGFHHAMVDGIFGPTTDVSLRAFQSDYGLVADGVCAPTTTRALRNLLPKVTGGSPSLLRSQAHRYVSGPELAGRHIFLDADEQDGDGFTWNIAERVRDNLEMLGANATLIGQAQAVDARARAANSGGAELYLSLAVARYAVDHAEGAAAYYFGSPNHVSTVGREIAGLLHRELVARTPFVDLGAHPRVREILRLTEMPTVLLELGHATNPADRDRMASDDVRAATAEGIVAAIQRFYLAAADEHPTGTWRIPRFA